MAEHPCIHCGRPVPTDDPWYDEDWGTVQFHHGCSDAHRQARPALEASIEASLCPLPPSKYGSG